MAGTPVLICTFSYSQREAVHRVSPFLSQENTVLAQVQGNWGVLYWYGEGGLMIDRSGIVSSNRKLIISQVEGKNSTRKCRGPCA